MNDTWRRNIGLAFRIIFAVLSALFLALQGLSEFGKFQDPAWLPVALAVGVAFFMCADGVTAAIGAAGKVEKDESRARVQKVVVGALVQIAEECRLELSVIGGSVFRVQRRFVWCHWKKVPHPRRMQVLTRTVRFRLRDYPQASKVLWTTGKGPIGDVLRNRAPRHVHWAPIAKKYAKDPPITREAFKKIPKKTRDCFTYDEFVEIVGRYAEVLAVPILSEDGGKLLGIISIDRPHEEDTQKRFGTSVKAIAETAAVAMRGDL